MNANDSSNKLLNISRLRSAFTLLALFLTACTPSLEKTLSDKVWFHIYDSNSGGHYFTDGEGYLFSSEEKVLYRFPDVDHAIRKEKGKKKMADMKNWQNIGQFSVENGRLKILDEDLDITLFDVENGGDTTVRGIEAKKITLRKEGGKEVYTLFQPKEEIVVNGK